MQKRPGVIIFFDNIRPFIKRFNKEDLGMLFTAIINYAEYGEYPDIDNPMVEMAFEVLQPKLDRDEEQYNDVILKRKYAGYCSAAKRNGNEPIEYEEWLEHMSTHVEKCSQMSTNSNGSNINNINNISNGSSIKKDRDSLKGEGKDDFPPVYNPMSESEFERERQRRLAMLVNNYG